MIYGQGAGNLLKSTYYNTFVSNEPSVFSTIDKVVHTRKRRMLSHAFSSRSLSNLEPFVHTVVVVSYFIF